MHHQHVRHRCHLRHRREVAQHVIRQLLVDDMVDGDGAGAEQQRVAVGRRARHRFDAERVAGAAAVLDVELLAEHLAQMRREHARAYCRRCRPPRSAPGSSPACWARRLSLRRLCLRGAGDQADGSSDRQCSLEHRTLPNFAIYLAILAVCATFAHFSSSDLICAAEFGRRVADRFRAVGRHALLHLRRFQRGGDLLVQPGNDRRRRARRREKPVPLDRLVAGHLLRRSPGCPA